jgi:hypothetical protein
MCTSRLYRQTAGIVLELLGWMHNSQMTGTLVHGVVFEPLRADVCVIPVNSGQVDVTLNAARLLVNVTVQFPCNVGLPQVPHGNAEICHVCPHQNATM